MFNIVMRLLFALSSISPILVATGLIGYLKGSFDIGQAVAMGVTGVALFLVGGILFLRRANKCGESVSIEGAVSSVVPSGQWLSVLFGSYLVPLDRRHNNYARRCRFGWAEYSSSVFPAFLWLQIL